MGGKKLPRTRVMARHKWSYQNTKKRPLRLATFHSTCSKDVSTARSGKRCDAPEAKPSREIGRESTDDEARQNSGRLNFGWGHSAVALAANGPRGPRKLPPDYGRCLVDGATPGRCRSDA